MHSLNRPPTLLCGLRSCCESHSISSYSLSCSCRAGNNSLLALSVALGILSLPPSLPCTNAASQPLLWLKDLLLNFPDWLASSQSFRAQSMRTLLCCGCDCCRSEHTCVVHQYLHKSRCQTLFACLQNPSCRILKPTSGDSL